MSVIKLEEDDDLEEDDGEDEEEVKHAAKAAPKLQMQC